HGAGGLQEVLDAAGLLVLPHDVRNRDRAVDLELRPPEVVGEPDVGRRNGANDVAVRSNLPVLAVLELAAEGDDAAKDDDDADDSPGGAAHSAASSGAPVNSTSRVAFDPATWSRSVRGFGARMREPGARRIASRRRRSSQ